jgi:hypothetical protein
MTTRQSSPFCDKPQLPVETRKAPAFEPTRNALVRQERFALQALSLWDDTAAANEPIRLNSTLADLNS